MKSLSQVSNFLTFVEGLFYRLGFAKITDQLSKFFKSTTVIEPNKAKIIFWSSENYAASDALELYTNSTTEVPSADIN